jgi:hypothetical protein
MASTGDSIDKRSILILICDTIDQDNNIGSNELEFDTFVDKYLSGGSFTRKFADYGQINSTEDNGSVLALHEIRKFVTTFLNDRVEKLRNDVKQNNDAMA